MCTLYALFYYYSLLFAIIFHSFYLLLFLLLFYYYFTIILYYLFRTIISIFSYYYFHDFLVCEPSYDEFACTNRDPVFWSVQRDQTDHYPGGQVHLDAEEHAQEQDK